MNECILLVDDDPAITEGLALALERPNRRIVICSDIESAEMALARFRITHLVTDVQFSGAFGFEGLHFLGRVHAQQPACRIVLITGYATDTLRATALGFGAVALLSKPFATEELERALQTRESDADGTPCDVVRIASVDDILNAGILDAAFQPIVRPGRAEIFGFEALTRIRGQWAGGGAAELYDYAARRSQLVILNLAALQRALEVAQQLPPSSLFVNLDPVVVADRQLLAALDAAEKRGTIPLSRFVLEITERSAFADDVAAGHTFDELRARGIRFALDDHGSAYSHLGLISRIRPSFIKISPSFGTGFETDETKARIVRHVLELAHDFGCQTVLEGIESEATARAATEFGVDFLQGFHFGRPQPVSYWSKVIHAAA